MTPGAQIAASIELLETLEAAWKQGQPLPADTLMGDYFKKRRFIGAKDKGFIARRLYGVLRHGASLQWWAEQAKLTINPRTMVLTMLVAEEKLPLDVLESYFTGRQHDPDPLSPAEQQFAKSGAKEAKAMPRWMQLNLPEWTLPLLEARFGDTLAAEAEALNSEAAVDIRVNLLKTTRDALRQQLRKEGFHSQPTPYSPWGLRLEKRGAIFNTQAFRDGWFEVQDEGSQLVSLLADAKPGQRVIDFCAGAGGKTLALAMAMQNKGRILAFDTSKTRLGQSTKRLRRAGVDNVQTTPISSESDKFLKRHAGTADRVLVDAPCSGSGTWRRNPDLKWRFSPSDLQEVCATQERILDACAKLVKSGGKLIYVTCSIFPSENHQQLSDFCARHPEFRVATMREIWNNIPSLMSLAPSGQAILELSPARHQTDGFFAAVLEKQ